jgi:small subunit ribosomal protein S21
MARGSPAMWHQYRAANLRSNSNNLQTIKNKLKLIMIIVPVKEGDNIERALKKFKRKTEKTGVIKELRTRQAFEKPSITNRKKMMKAEYVQQLRNREE